MLPTATKSPSSSCRRLTRSSEKDRGKILDAMFATKDFKSLLGGTCSFTETGDTDALTMAVNEIKPNAEGKLDFAFLETIGV